MVLKFFRKRLNKKGFTLVELIVVIAILAILAVVAVPRFIGIQTNSRRRVNITNREMLQRMVRLHQQEEGSLPDSTDLEDAKYLGEDEPVPVITGDSGEDGDAASGDMFQMDSSGNVTIGHSNASGIVNLSGAASND